jgi:hypothetical protein
LVQYLKICKIDLKCNLAKKYLSGHSRSDTQGWKYLIATCMLKVPSELHLVRVTEEVQGRKGRKAVLP